VLFDSRQANIAFYNAILSNFDQPPLSPEAVEYIHSHTVQESVTYIFQGYPELDAVFRFCRTIDYRPYIPMMVEEPHLREFLGFLRPGHHTALATNRTTTTQAVLDYHRLAGDFDLVVSAQDVAQPKPNQEAFVRILDHFGLEPRQAIFIGDSRVDEEFAANAGVPFVAYRNPQLKADYYLDSFSQGPGLILDLAGARRT
jgi:phosphoglycolate phosphatase